ncbi:MAG: hypothetical protein IPJ42_04070 [Betaproteobacteria bacterium]|nr:hypothetical protein [Betaproteobacteria bacterium]
MLRIAPEDHAAALHAGSATSLTRAYRQSCSTMWLKRRQSNLATRSSGRFRYRSVRRRATH